MSALDQALIKAFDKPTGRPLAPPLTAPAAVQSAAAPQRAAANAAAIERLYHDGGLYRVDIPVRDSNIRARNERATLGAPHYDLPPPTSPHRGVRRSIMRLLANQQAPAIHGDELDPPAPPRVRRKVIIRHISHSGAFAGASPIPPPHLPAFTGEQANQTEAREELGELAAQVEVAAPWDIGAMEAMSCIVVYEPDDLRVSMPDSLVNVQLDSLPEPRTADIWTGVEQRHSADTDQPAGTFATKSLDDDHPATIRADQGHARGPGRPHLSYGSPKSDAPAAPEPSDTAEFSLADEDPPLAELVEAPAISTEHAQPDAARSAVPVWEVDSFHWPRTCEKLLADESGYLAQAGEKLQAAVRDGLKTLAITGSRRGEGRTTLALCLARVAARAGIQVALLDADFARPSLSSRLGLEISHGWQDAALGLIPLSEAAVKSLADNITVLPLEVSSARRGLSLADPRVTATLRAAVATFELVIVDLGPIGPGERMEFPPGEACPLDATIVVRDLRFASAAESHEVGERLYDAGIEAVGIAENFVTDEDRFPLPLGEG